MKQAWVSEPDAHTAVLEAKPALRLGFYTSGQKGNPALLLPPASDQEGSQLYESKIQAGLVQVSGGRQSSSI